MIEVHAEFPQREVIQANAVVDNEEKTVSEVIISAKPEITGVTASVDNETGTPYVDVTETGTGIEYSFDLAFHNLKGDKGERGETGQTGQDGFSPIATVEPIQDGAKITITDKDGTTTTNVYNGQDGQDGADGQAATVTVGTTTTGAAGTNASVVNSGTSSAAILDFTIPRGDKGETGATGQDGFSPSASVSQSGGVTTISITDKNGTTTESIDLSNYATQTDLTNGLSTKQDTISDLSTIRSNAANGQSAYTTIGGYGDIVTYNASNFVQKNGDSSTQTISLTSGTGTTALGIKSMATSSYISLSGSSGWLGSYGVSSSKRAVFYNGTGYTLAYTSEIPTKTSDLTNDSGYITGIDSSDVITALGYTPYDSSNPNGYTSNVGTVTSVNNTQPDANGNVTISVTGGANTDLSNLTATGEAHFQEPLVSGTNIKTINNTSLLGSGDISVGSYSAGTGLSLSGTTFNHSNSVNAGTIGTSSATSGSTISVPYATYDAQGHITGKGTHTHTVTGFLTSSSTQVASSRFDGQWVLNYQVLSTATAKSSTTMSLSSYLPSDSSTYDYEVMIYADAHASSNVAVSVGTVSSPIDNNCFKMSGYIRSNATEWAGYGIFPISHSNRNIYSQRGAAVASSKVVLLGYRRIGTNT